MTQAIYQFVILSFTVDAEKIIFGCSTKETDFLFTCCEGLKISLHSLYSVRTKLADEVNENLKFNFF